jgi:LPXTG-motif cell wall-anchored protein
VRVKRTTLSLRRLSILVGGALLGMTAAIAIAAPASAHHSEVIGEPRCDTATGEWVVKWTVNSVAPQGVTNYKLVQVKVSPDGSTITNIAQTTTNDFPYTVGTPIVGEQRLPGNSTSASLTVQAKWINGFQEANPVSKTVKFGGPCNKDMPKPKPTASFSTSCDGTVKVTVTFTAAVKEAVTFTVVGENGSSAPLIVPAGQTSASIVVPADVAGKVTVKQDKKTIGEPYTRQLPADCSPVSPVKVASKSDCTSLAISIENPKDSKTPVEATLTPKGGAAKKVTVAPGETKEVSFAAKAGTVVTLTIDNKSADIAWENPGNCTPGNGGGGPSLPVTGASLGGAIGAAGGLLAIGGALFVFFRRRRIRFTA